MSTALCRLRSLMERFNIVVCYFPSSGKWHVLRHGFNKSEHKTETAAFAAAQTLLTNLSVVYDLEKGVK